MRTPEVHPGPLQDLWIKFKNPCPRSLLDFRILYPFPLPHSQILESSCDMHWLGIVNPIWPIPQLEFSIIPLPSYLPGKNQWVFNRQNTLLLDAEPRSQVRHDVQQRSHMLLLFGSKEPEIEPLSMTTFQTSLPNM